MAAITQGNHRAFSTLVTRHSSKFYALAYRTLAQQDIAEDIVQDAFTRLWHKPHLWKADKNTKFTTWFYRIILNLCMDYRRKHPFAAAALNDSLTSKENTDQQLEKSAQQSLLEQAIQQLPERQQTALNLCFYEDMNHKDAADIMQVSVKALESLLSRAKATLKKEVSNHVA